MHMKHTIYTTSLSRVKVSKSCSSTVCTVIFNANYKLPHATYTTLKPHPSPHITPHLAPHHTIHPLDVPIHVVVGAVAGVGGALAVLAVVADAPLLRVARLLALVTLPDLWRGRDERVRCQLSTLLNHQDTGSNHTRQNRYIRDVDKFIVFEFCKAPERKEKRDLPCTFRRGARTNAC